MKIPSPTKLQPDKHIQPFGRSPVGKLPLVPWTFVCVYAFGVEPVVRTVHTLERQRFPERERATALMLLLVRQ